MAQKYAKVRKDEILFKKSLFRFSFLFSVVLAFGLVSQRIVNSLDIKRKITNEIKISEDFFYDIGKPKIKFSQGMMPVLGLSFDRVEFKQKKCSGRRLVAQDALLVINPWRLLRGQLKLGWASIAHVEIDYQKKCRSSTVDDLSQRAVVLGDRSLIDLSKNYESELKIIFDKIKKILTVNRLTYLLVDKVILRSLNGGEEEILVKAGVSAQLKQNLKAELKILEIEHQGKPLPLNSAKVLLDFNEKQINSSAVLKVREGKVTFKVQINNSPNFEGEVLLSLKKVPLSVVSQYFSENIQVNYLWVNCVASVHGSMKNFRENPLNIKACKVEGPYGGATLQNLKANLKSVSSLEFNIDELELNKVFTERRLLPFSGVLSDFGRLSGQAIYSNGEVSASGHLRDLDVVFSNNNLRDVQKVRQVPFFIKGSDKQIQVLISEIDLIDGEFVGEMRFQYQPDLKIGKGKLSIDRLIFNPKIYHLMISANPSLLKLYGKFILQNGEMKDWSVFLMAPQVKSESYRLNNLKIKGEGQTSEPSRVRVSAISGSVTKNSKVFSWIESTLLNKMTQENELGFNELSVKLSVFNNRSIKWNRGYLRLMDGWQLSTEGFLDGQKKAKGWVQWDRPKLPNLKWSFQGDFFKSKWKPENQWLVQWLSKNPDFVLSHSDIDFAQNESEGIGKRLEKVGKEAIDKVKSVLKSKDE